MRRLLFGICAVFAAASVVSLSTLAAHAQSADQYASSDATEATTQGPQETTVSQETPAPEEKPSGASSSPESMVVQGSVSQGSVTDPNSPEVIAAREDLAEEESLPDYSQVVDNTTEGAFRAPGWKDERGSLSYKDGFAAAGRAKAPASFEVEIPTSNDYSVYVWWPGTKDAGVARYSLQTASGTKSEKVDQRSDSSGMWILLGTYAMEEGQRTVEVAPKPVDGGQVFADAVAVVRGAAPPPEDQTVTASGTRATDSKSLERFSGRDVVRQARKHWHDDYAWGTCTQKVKSCTCLTKVSVNPFGHNMGMTENGQWRYDRSRKIPKSRLKPGDEVFFKENGPGGPITHVGIFSGRGNIVHASAYAGWVTETKMKYITDSNNRSAYFGAKRFKSR
jgi:cell wall-associated NlpC family hydrolase